MGGYLKSSGVKPVSNCPWNDSVCVASSTIALTRFFWAILLK